MTTLFRNGTVINVFTGEMEKANVLIENGTIIGVGDYDEGDETIDLTGKFLAPGLIDSHIHIESTMLLPYEFARAVLPHGTTAVIADPHEIGNVAGTAGLRFMLEGSRGLPLDFYWMMPSCVPSTRFDESGAVLSAGDLAPFYDDPMVLGLGEVMDYTGVETREPELMKKIAGAAARGKTVNGHAPLQTGRALDRYIAAGVTDDHECSSAEEAAERIRKGQRVMIREGTAAKNLEALLPMFDPPYCARCLLATDDKHPADLLTGGHIDMIIRKAAASGKNPVTGIRMATIQTAEYYGLKRTGAVAPGYRADLIVLSDLKKMQVEAVYKDGRLAAEKGKAVPFKRPKVSAPLSERVKNSMRLNPVSSEDFAFQQKGVHRCRVIRRIPGQLLTDEELRNVDLGKGFDLEKDILKIAVIERHHMTGHIGLGLIHGTGLKAGAVASSVGHDAHNLVVIGTSDREMAAAANAVKECGGGMAAVKDGKVIGKMALPYGGLMTDRSAEEAAKENAALRASLTQLGLPEGEELFMTTAFLSLPVIPHLKLTTKGLVDVDRQELVELTVD